MVYESSYESGLKPFRYDTGRGYWASPHDFLYACICNAFKIDIITFMPLMLFYELGILSIIPYFLSLAIFIVPIVVIQSFLGQFSSSGFISVFRIAPLFKGMGYVSLVINLTMLTYYSIFAAIPMVFFIHSFRPTLPWSCGATNLWSEEELENITTICNYNTSLLKTDAYYRHKYIHVPSNQFFKVNVIDISSSTLSFSWSLFGCMLLVWAAVAYILCNRTETIGKIIRYAVITALGLVVACLIRFLFLPGAFVGLKAFLFPEIEPRYWFVATTMLATNSFGNGWGSILTMASYNKFKTNISLYSWIICGGQFAILVLLGLNAFLVEYHFKDFFGNEDYRHFEELSAFLTIPSAITHMALSNLWSMIFLAMLIIGAGVLVVVQLFSILTALFDEFEQLRSKKHEVTLGLVALLAVGSIYFCSNHGIRFLFILPQDSVVVQTAMNLLLLLVVLWIYGRERFQRDIEFMTHQKFSTWKVYMVRFVAPIFLLIIMLFGIVMVVLEHIFNHMYIVMVTLIVVLLPWVAIPGYAIFSLLQTTGSLCIRFRRCVRPRDWYPADPDDRQQYEEAMGNMDITYQLNEVLE